MSVSKQIKMMLVEKEWKVSDLADAMSTKDKKVSSQNIHNKLKRDNFTESDIKDFAAALGAEAKIVFTMKDTNKEF